MCEDMFFFLNLHSITIKTYIYDKKNSMDAGVPDGLGHDDLGTDIEPECLDEGAG